MNEAYIELKTLHDAVKGTALGVYKQGVESLLPSKKRRIESSPPHSALLQYAGEYLSDDDDVLLRHFC